MRLLILFTLLILTSSGCSKSKESHSVETPPQLLTHKIVSVSDEKLSTVDLVATTVKVTVKPSITKVDLEKLLNALLNKQYNRNTPLGPAQHFTIQAYYDNDPSLKNVVGSVSQVPPHRIAFEYNGVISYDREETMSYQRERTPTQKERDAYVGKVAAGLVKEATKIRDSK